MSHPSFQTHSRILAGSVAFVFAAVLLATVLWPPEKDPPVTFDARAEYRALGTNAFPQFIKVLNAPERFDSKQRVGVKP